MQSSLETPPSSTFLPEDGSAGDVNLLKTPSQSSGKGTELDGQSSQSAERVATPLSECPRSTIYATGSQVGAVFGNASGGGNGSLTYDGGDADDSRVKDAAKETGIVHGLGVMHSTENPSIVLDEDASEVAPTNRSPVTHHLLASPRQTRAPPCTPSCNEVNSFGWLTFDTQPDDADESAAGAEGRMLSHTYRKAKAGHTLWGMPRSDTFGTLSGAQAGSAAESALVEEESDEDGRHSGDEQDKENVCGERHGQRQQKADKPAQQPRRPSFFSFHLSSSLLRAKTGLDNRRYSDDDGDADGSG